MMNEREIRIANALADFLRAEKGRRRGGLSPTGRLSRSRWEQQRLTRRKTTRSVEQSPQEGHTGGFSYD